MQSALLVEHSLFINTVLRAEVHSSMVKQGMRQDTHTDACFDPAWPPSSISCWNDFQAFSTSMECRHVLLTNHFESRAVIPSAEGGSCGGCDNCARRAAGSWPSRDFGEQVRTGMGYDGWAYWRTQLPRMERHLSADALFLSWTRPNPPSGTVQPIKLCLAKKMAANHHCKHPAGFGSSVLDTHD